MVTIHVCMILILLIYALHVHADSCLEEIHELRKIVQENTGMIRALRETVNIQERRIQHLETCRATSEDEKLNLARRLETLENLNFEINEDLKVELGTDETRFPESLGTEDVATRKVHSAKKIVQSGFQSAKINSKENENHNLETGLRKSEDEILDSKRKLENLTSKPKSVNCPKETLPIQDSETTNVKAKEIKQAKQKVVSQRASPGVVAFYAYMSHDENNPGPHHTIIFDVPVTNLGNSYNHFSGTFSVPSSGVYVFSWTITCSSRGYVFSQLVANNDVLGAILTNSLTTDDWISTTGLVVKEVNEGDVVYVRTNPASNPVGDIKSSSTHDRTSFSGWKLQ